MSSRAFANAAGLDDSTRGCEVVSRWIADRQGYHDYITGLPFTDFAVEPCEPYFVGMSEDSVWP